MGHAFQLAPEAQKAVMDSNLEAKIHPRTPIWRPRAFQRPRIGGPKRSKEPNLEVRSPSKTPGWRPIALQDLNLGFPSAQKSSTWSSKAFQASNLEAQSAPRPQFGGSKRFQDTNLKAQILLRNQTLMISATRSKSRRPNHMENQKHKEKPPTPTRSLWFLAVSIALQNLEKPV